MFMVFCFVQALAADEPKRVAILESVSVGECDEADDDILADCINIGMQDARCLFSLILNGSFRQIYGSHTWV